ncbi:uncharacterized protein KY384_003544 [Bacidia gigantensis]|uniref:uncharacterized protein n=1 Tax=Bacidia gigantensis TaxID=2732470 RepID=UPI001D03F91A|nr:uncharacterized protein KY384_003544 [Bacidia gigantensis]KAG8531908.1 hypothetical protein KY384_003544 [Bacidia gigantensis]
MKIGMGGHRAKPSVQGHGLGREEEIAEITADRDHESGDTVSGIIKNLEAILESGQQGDKRIEVAVEKDIDLFEITVRAPAVEDPILNDLNRGLIKTLLQTLNPMVPNPQEVKTHPNGDMEIDENPEEAEMRRMLGFGGFKTTKNTKVKGNNVYGVRKENKIEYRQYMNRVGGFNRPLSPSRQQ